MAETIRQENLRKTSQTPKNNFKQTKFNKLVNTPSNYLENHGDDFNSLQGKFGWTLVGNISLPYITRSGIKFCSVRILEKEIVNKYKKYFNDEIYSCVFVQAHNMTMAESALFNEINMKHCDSFYGKEIFKTNDLIVRLEDGEELQEFLACCLKQFLNFTGRAIYRCGFVKVNKESLVPYSYINGTRYVPLYYFDGEFSSLQDKTVELAGWNLAYLKVCLKMQGIKRELYESNSCNVAPLDDVKKLFPENTTFEEYWPLASEISCKFLKNIGEVSVGIKWTSTTNNQLSDISSNQNSNNKFSIVANSNTADDNFLSCYSNDPFRSNANGNSSSSTEVYSIYNLSQPNSSNGTSYYANFLKGNLSEHNYNLPPSSSNFQNARNRLQTYVLQNQQTPILHSKHLSYLIDLEAKRLGCHIVFIKDEYMHTSNLLYKISKLFFEKKTIIDCINIMPYDYNLLMFKMEDVLAKIFGNSVTVEVFLNILKMANIELLKPNKLQIQYLINENMWNPALNVFMLPVRSVLLSIPHLKYLLQNVLGSKKM